MTFSYSEVLTLWYVRGVIQKNRSSAFYLEKASTVTQADLEDMFKRPSRVPVHLLLWYLLTIRLLLYQLLHL
jgi:hypothetical protein